MTNIKKLFAQKIKQEFVKNRSDEKKKQDKKSFTDKIQEFQSNHTGKLKKISHLLMRMNMFGFDGINHITDVMNTNPSSIIGNDEIDSDDNDDVCMIHTHNTGRGKHHHDSSSSDSDCQQENKDKEE